MSIAFSALSGERTLTVARAAAQRYVFAAEEFLRVDRDARLSGDELTQTRRHWALAKQTGWREEVADQIGRLECIGLYGDAAELWLALDLALFDAFRRV